MKVVIKYPRSFRRLLVLGFAMAVLPLMLGLIGNAFSIWQLSGKSRQAVYGAVSVTRESLALIANIDAQERVVRQFQVLHEPRLLDAYRNLHAELDDIAARLAAMSLTAAQRQALAVIAERENALEASLSQVRIAAGTALISQESIGAHYAALLQAANEFIEQNNQLIDDEVAALQALTAQSERIMAFQLLALLPAAAVLVFGFTRLLAAPIGQLESAIGGLWAGRFDRRIEVGGPSDLQDIGAQLDRLRLRLMQLEERKSRFLRSVAHQLKTPLAALREGSDLLAEGKAGPLTAQQREIADILIDNSQRLRRLVEDLLAYNAADFEQSVLHRQVFPLRDLVDAVVEGQALALAARDLRIESAIEDLAIDADRERIRTVLDNLLSNAAKYSPPSGTIRLQACRQGNEAIIEVADEGPGVANEDRDRIFDPFYQGRIPAAGPVKGSGLGLSIAQEHVLAHGGRLSLAEGAGARFQVRLPLPWN